MNISAPQLKIVLKRNFNNPMYHYLSLLLGHHFTPFILLKKYIIKKVDSGW